MTKRAERENIEKIQQCFVVIKNRAQEERKRWEAAGDAEKLNAWYKLEAKMMVVHAEATEDLLRLFPEFSPVVTDGPVVLGGGGGR